MRLTRLQSEAAAKLEPELNVFFKRIDPSAYDAARSRDTEMARTSGIAMH